MLNYEYWSEYVLRHEDDWLEPSEDMDESRAAEMEEAEYINWQIQQEIAEEMRMLSEPK